MFLLCLKELVTNNVEIRKLACLEYAASQTQPFLSPLFHLKDFNFPFLYVAGERLKGKVVWGGDL